MISEEKLDKTYNLKQISMKHQTIIRLFSSYGLKNYTKT